MSGIGALFRSHFVLLVLYSLFVSLFFALLLRRGRKPVLRFFASLLVIMIGGVLLAAWLMYFLTR